MFRLLFVCYGNICRSPMAEFIMRDLAIQQGLEQRLAVDSCATSAEQIGSPIYPPARDVLVAHGVPCSPRVARQMTAADYAASDLILAMDYDNLRDMEEFVGTGPEHKVFLLKEYAGESGEVADPWYSGDFATAYAEIAAACRVIIARLQI